jgi:predicted Na+-dependent transporter
MTSAKEIGAHAILFFLVFGMSATVDIGHMRKQLRNRKAIGTGIFLQFFILPFVGFALVNILHMSAPVGITLLVVTSSPGGSYSNCEYSILLSCRRFLKNILSRFLTNQLCRINEIV